MEDFSDYYLLPTTYCLLPTADTLIYYLRMVKEPRGGQPLSRSLKVYQRIAVAFVFMTFFLLLAVLYLSVSRATITVVANPRVIAVDTEVEAVPNPTANGQLSGIVMKQSFETQENITLPEAGATPTEEKAGGTVTIINESNAAQRLSRTRLLSKDGVLFHIDSAVNVPEGTSGCDCACGCCRTFGRDRSDAIHDSRFAGSHAEHNICREH